MWRWILTTLISLSTAVWARPDIQSRLNQLDQKIPLIAGPNCWNSVLFTQGLIDHLRYSTPEELEFWLGSPYCRKLKTTEISKSSPEKYDVIAIRNRQGQVHSMTWMAGDQVFSKNTSHRRDAYEFVRADLIYSMFRVTESNCRQPSSKGKKSCSTWSDIYRCQSAQEDRSKYINQDPAFKTLYLRLEDAQRLIRDSIFLPTAQPRLQSIAESVSQLLKPIEQQIILNPNTFFFQALQFEVDSLNEQVRIIKSQKERN